MGKEKIESVMPQGGEAVETNEDTYIRYAADVWYVWEGENLEPLCFCEELEEEYQKFILQRA